VGEASFVALAARTFGADDPASLEEFRQGTGATNAPPRVGPIVLSEIMYHPPDSGTNDNVRDEFIELHNIGSVTAPLIDPTQPTNRWRLRDAVDFDFPPALTLAAGARLLVVSFDPTTNATQLADFRSRLGIPAGVTILGPWSGNLDSAGETIELKAPDRPDVTGGTVLVPYVLVEQVHYRPTAPWPSGANGTGQSLQRRALGDYGNDPINWCGAGPTPGQANAAPIESFIISVAPGQGGILVSSLLGVTYTLEYSDQLPAANWTAVEPGTAGTGAPLLLTDPNPPLTQRFYRVRAQ
jgi:hypothetical protein